MCKYMQNLMINIVLNSKWMCSIAKTFEINTFLIIAMYLLCLFSIFEIKCIILTHPSFHLNSKSYYWYWVTWNWLHCNYASFFRFNCGNNIHISCMKVWADHQTKRDPRGLLKCPLCREDFCTFKQLIEQVHHTKK